MRGLRISIGVIVIVAVFLLPITCICELMQVDGLQTAPPHLTIFSDEDHSHSPVKISAATSSAAKPAAVQVAPANAAAAAEQQQAHCSLLQQGGFLTELDPVLLATLPATSLLPLTPPADLIRAASPPTFAQCSPAPPTPPPAL